jgi:rod shape determining protein RodA
MIDARLRKNLDVPLLLTTLLIVAMGILTIYSASHASPGRFYQKQVIWFCLGVVGMGLAAWMDYTRLPRFSRTLYILNLLPLLFVMKFGEEKKGAIRWIEFGGFQFQPSEFSKIIMIVCLAVFLSARQHEIRKFSTLAYSFLYIGVPTFLIFRQPDLGTSLVLVAIWFGMTFIAGAKLNHLAVFLLTGLLLFTCMWHFNILKDYQKNRMSAFLNPEIDPKETGYHVLQSRIAIGSGKTMGKGFGNGTQVQGKFIPENHTDFIFTVVGEEGGFVVSTLLVLLYGIFFVRGGLIAAHAEDPLGQLIATGIVAMYAFHTIVNLGMTIGIMPVTGVPLPLFSYGGSSMLLNLTSIGLLLGIGMRRHKLMF